MKTIPKRLLSLLLAFVLALGCMPTVYATTGKDSGAPTTPAATEAVPPTTPVEKETEPPSSSAPTTPETEPEAGGTTEATEPAVDLPESDPSQDMLTGSDAAAYASTQNSIMLFDYSDNGNYTTVLKSQINISYKWNGTGSTLSCYLKNMGWHFARYNNTPYADNPLYCIEPHKNYAASTSGNSVDRDMTLDGSSSTTGGNIWYSLNANRREAIGLILLYSNQMWDHSISVSTTKRDNNPNVPLRVATQFLIFEIVTGLRDADTFQRNSKNECGTAGDIYYNAGVASVSGFASNYNSLVSRVEASMQIPSFTSASSSTAPTITLTGDTTSVYDNNGVLSGFTFSNGNGAKFSKSGNTLNITQTGTISESTVFKATKSIPSAENTTYSIWYMRNSNYQTTINLYSPEDGTLNAYFKLKAPALGNLSLTKTTEDGKNLSGWRFGIYSNSSCTNLVSGPHTTNSSGKISVTGLNAGTYYVKELGHTDSAISAQYVCSSTNPQKVTITNGGTASVSFVNKRNEGSLALIKSTDDGNNLGGWQFSIYKDSACTSLVSGPHTTDANGKLTVTGITPGTYYVKEIGHTNAAISEQYACATANPQTVTIALGGTATVKFSNKIKTGSLNLIKVTDDGKNLGGWQFGIYSDSGCTKQVSGPHTTDSNGKLSVNGLKAGTYYVKELGNTDSTLQAVYTCTDENPQKVTISYNSTAEVTFHNRQNPGSVKIVKQTNTGSNVSGWKIGIYSDAACTKPISGSPFTTSPDGTITISNLTPQTLYAKEMPVDDPYWAVDSSVKTIEVTANETATVTFRNTHYGDLRIKKNAINGSAEDWSFQILDENRKLVATISTGQDGYATSGKLLPGKYFVVEIHDRDETYWTYDATVERQVTVTAGKQAEVAYTNEQFGRLEFQKTTNTGNHLAGWVFRVKDTDGNHIGDYTTDETGHASTGKLKPGRYVVIELATDDLYWQGELGYHDATIVAGKTTVDKWHNKELGLGWFYKSTNTGKSVEGWEITVYTDKECTKKVTTLTTNEDGKVGMYLEPGTYYAKETGDTQGRWENEYWMVDESVKELEIKAHEDTEVFFVNTQYGKLKIVKSMPSGGSLAGWQFVIRNAEGAEIEGSPFTTDSTGLIVSENLLPGVYTVEELLPEDSIYICTSQNPQTITVVQGETAQAAFTNTLKVGRISIRKVDAAEEPLAGAEFLLEWSSDGATWLPVSYTDSEYAKVGTCSSTGLVDGKLLSGTDGMVTFEGLHPDCQYRLTETQAPNGYQLLAEAAYTGKLPLDKDFVLELTVVNARTYKLPNTGAKSLVWMPVSLLAACGTCCAILYLLKRKNRW